MDLQPLPVLFVGGIVGMCLPKAPQLARHRGEAGVAQAQLELAAQTMDRAEQLLTEQLLDPVDREALIAKAVQRACGSCPCRKNCRESQTAEQLQGEILERPMIHVDDLPIGCKKRGRLLLELRWGQDQLRMLKADPAAWTCSLCRCCL